LISIPPEKKIENKITMLISYNIYSDMHNRICGVIVSVIVSNAIDGGFEARAGQTKDYKICIGCFSVMQTVLRRKSKDSVAQSEHIIFWFLCSEFVSLNSHPI
jgi:hypothetical protein